MSPLVVPIITGLAALYTLSRRGKGPLFVGPRVRRRLEELRYRALPAELAAPVPRPDVWGQRGYLSQPDYHERYKPLLLEGYATYGFVFQYHSENDGEGPDVTATYAWLDVEGKLRTHRLKESYDGMHAAYSQGQGQMVVDMDAHLELDKVIIILESLETGEHVIYQALRAEP